MMKNEIKFVHTNIVAKDWKKLSQFYIDVFGCEPVYPERDLSGTWIDKMTKIANVRIKGVHLRLPGYDNGPTLEIFEYNKMQEVTGAPLINRTGFSHIAFHVSDVEKTMKRLIAGGGEKYGELVEKEMKGLGILKAIYARDIEGNIIEIQNWKKE
jgi:predicted enzyme related to lactoylglutathione lyase